MVRARRLAFAAVLACLCLGLLMAAPASAFWPANERIPICTTAGKSNQPIVSGDIVAWRDSRTGTEHNWSLMGYDMGKRKEFTIAQPINSNAVIYGDIAAYGRWESAVSTDRAGSTVSWDEIDIYATDLATGEEFVVCDAPGEQCKAAVGDGFIAWVDGRTVDNSPSVDQKDIWMLDLATGVESRITSTTGNEGCVVAGGGTIGWKSGNNIYVYDVESQEATLAYNTGGATLYELAMDDEGERIAFVQWVNWYDLHLYDIASDMVSEIDTATGYQYMADIDGDWVVYVDTEVDGDGDVHGKNMDSGVEVTIAAGPYCQGNPGIDDGLVVHTDDSASEGGQFPDIYGTYLYEQPVSFKAVSGADRFATSAAASKKAFPDGADTVVIATGRNWPDALGAASLAGAHRAPVLLTEPDELPGDIAAEIARLGAVDAYIIGGTSAVSEDVEDELAGMLGGTVARVGGADRYETAELIAAETAAAYGDEFPTTAILAVGTNYPDALAASPLSYAAGLPVFLVGPGGISDGTVDTMADLGIKELVFTGPLRPDASYGASNLLLGGEDRYETARLIADYAIDEWGLSPHEVAVATGEGFADAMAGAYVAGENGCVMLLTPTASLSAHLSDFLTDNGDILGHVNYLGGTSAISSDVRSDLEDLF